MKKFALLATFSFAMVAGSVNAQAIVYSNTTTATTAGFSTPYADNATFGDTMTLTQGGLLQSLAFSIFNSTTGGNTGIITTCSVLVNLYDNTVAYAGGPITNPLVGSINFNVDFGAGLNAGFFSIVTSNDLTGLNINLPTQLLMTQNLTQTGTSNSVRTGVVLLSNPTVGSSPNTVYIQSAANPANLYTINGGANPGQFAYQISVVPEPTSMALVGLGAAAFGWRRWRRK